jgi:hypothetical protein
LSVFPIFPASLYLAAGAICADMQRLDRGDRSDAVLLAPGKKFLHCAAKGVARGRFADVRDEKFPGAGGRASGLN